MRSQFLKSFVLILITLPLIYLSSCKGDDAESDIIGTWVISSILQSNCTDEANNGTTTPTCSDTDCVRIVFSAGNEYEIQTTSGGTLRRDSGTFSVDGGNIDLCEEDEGQLECDSFAISVSGSQLVLTATDNSTGCQVRTTYVRES